MNEVTHLKFQLLCLDLAVEFLSMDEDHGTGCRVCQTKSILRGLYFDLLPF